MILIFLIPKEKKNVFNVFSKDIIVPVLIFSFVSVMGCQYSYFMAIYYSNSATATVLEYIAPALVMLFTCISTLQSNRWLCIIIKSGIEPIKLPQPSICKTPHFEESVGD